MNKLFDQLNSLMTDLSKTTDKAQKLANQSLNELNGKISPNDMNKIKNLTNFENINNEQEILARIEEIKAWEQSLHR
jgi:phosphoenolpyruvate carboxylase